MIQRFKSDKRIKLIDYLAVFLLVISCGTAYFYLYNAGSTLLILLFFSFFYAINKKVKFKVNCFTVIYVLLILVNYLLFGYDMNLVGDLIFLMSTFLVVSSSNYTVFRRAFLDVTVFLAIVSILFEALFLSGIISPVLYGAGKGGLFGHYLYCYHAFGGGLWGISSQLYGIFWEPGIYQMILNIALLMNLDLLDKLSKIPSKRIKIITLVLAVVLTRSTTGYLTLGIIFVGYFVKNSAKSPKSKISAILSMIVFGIVVVSSSVITDKFSDDNASFIARSNDWTALTNAIITHPLWGSGVNAAAFEKVAVKFGMHGSKSAGILFQTAQMGLFWLFAYYYSLRKEFYKRNLHISIVFYIIAITFLGIGEPLMYSPLMLLLVLPFKKYQYE